MDAESSAPKLKRRATICRVAALRVENQLGYKMVKWIERIEFIKSEKLVGKGEGGKNEDDEYFDLLPNISEGETDRLSARGSSGRFQFRLGL